jgi:hypothetical protein
VASGAVGAAWSYQVTVPEQPLAVSNVLVPEQMVDANGDIAGAAGNGFTVTTVLAAGLLHVPLTQAA